MKNPALKYLTPAIAGVCLGLLPSNTRAELPVFSATFPASWNGTGTTVANLGGGAGVGFQSGTTGATYSTAPADLPPGATAGTGSMVLNTKAGIKVTPTAYLNNTTVAAYGGFEYDIDFMWNGGVGTFATQKLVDYAGTESLELDNLTASTSATLDMTFGGNTAFEPSVPETTVFNYTIAPNTWYNVSMIFNTGGNSVEADGDLAGMASLYVNGSLVDSEAATKGNYGDALNRPIAIGELAYGHTTSIVGLDGDIYSASVELAPEPSTLAMSGMGGLGVLGMMWKARRRKA